MRTSLLLVSGSLLYPARVPTERLIQVLNFSAKEMRPDETEREAIAWSTSMFRGLRA